MNEGPSDIEQGGDAVGKSGSLITRLEVPSSNFELQERHHVH